MDRKPKLVLGIEVERHQPNDEEETPLGKLRFVSAASHIR